MNLNTDSRVKTQSLRACWFQELDIIDKDDPYKQKAFDPRITHMRYLGIHYYVKKSDWKQDL